MPSLVTAVIKPFRLDEVRTVLQEMGVLGLTASEVQGYGRQGGKSETFRGSEYTTEFVPKVKLEIVVRDEDVDRVVEAVAEAAKVGKIGDGKIWTTDVGRVTRIRTGDVGDAAI